MDISLEV